ncbi:MAG: hypothetical protein JF924_19080 [Candidatus Dormibacteraeota bacterium]|nr:hypothetical protein [Candidatus Dormibacteraeota bacterium]
MRRGWLECEHFGVAATDDDALFPLEPVEEAGATEKKEAEPVEKTFWPYDQSQMLLLPPSLDEWLPEGHLGRFVCELVEEALGACVGKPLSG